MSQEKQSQDKYISELEITIEKQNKEIANLKKVISYIDQEKNRFFND